MGWSIGWDNNWQRDIGYGVPCKCDYPKCNKKIDRGLSYVCGGEPYGGEYGCGLYFCSEHLAYRTPKNEEKLIQMCHRCRNGNEPYKPKPDLKEWIDWKMTDPSWKEWRKDRKTL